MACKPCADKQAEIDQLRAENRKLGEELIRRAEMILQIRRILMQDSCFKCGRPIDRSKDGFVYTAQGQLFCLDCGMPDIYRVPKAKGY